MLFGKEVGELEGFGVVVSSGISPLVLLADKVETVSEASPLSVRDPDVVGKLDMVVGEGWVSEGKGKNVGVVKGFVAVDDPGGFGPVRVMAEDERELPADKEREAADEGAGELLDDGEKEVAGDGERRVTKEAEVAEVADDTEGKELDELDDLAGLDRLHKLSARLAASEETS